MNGEDRLFLRKSVAVTVGDVVMTVVTFVLFAVSVLFVLFSVSAFVVSCFMGGWMQPIALVFMVIVMIANAQSGGETSGWADLKTVPTFLAVLLFVLAGVADVRQAFGTAGDPVLSSFLFVGAFGALCVASIMFAIVVCDSESELPDHDVQEGYGYA